MDKLRQIVQTMAETAREAGVSIITGDTKVVERGGADGVYINTAGVGEVPADGAQRRKLPARRCHPGLGYTGRPRHRYHEPTRGSGVFEHDRKRRRTAQPPDCRCAFRSTRHTLLSRPHARWLGVHTQRVCPGQQCCHGGRRGCRARASRRAGRLRDARLRCAAGGKRGQDGCRRARPSKPMPR